MNELVLHLHWNFEHMGASGEVLQHVFGALEAAMLHQCGAVLS